MFAPETLPLSIVHPFTQLDSRGLTSIPTPAWANLEDSILK